MARTAADKLLLVPVLDSLSDDAVPIAQEDTREAWARADQERADYLLWRRRLCGLEIAGLLAGPWETVEILDCRWWRILEDGKTASGSPPVQDQTWSAETALLLAAPDGCRLFNLPAVGVGKGRTIHPNTLAAVRHWLTSRIGPVAEKSTFGSTGSQGRPGGHDPGRSFGDLGFPDQSHGPGLGTRSAFQLVVAGGRLGSGRLCGPGGGGLFSPGFRSGPAAASARVRPRSSGAGLQIWTTQN